MKPLPIYENTVNTKCDMKANNKWQHSLTSLKHGIRLFVDCQHKRHSINIKFATVLNGHTINLMIDIVTCDSQ